MKKSRRDLLLAIGSSAIALLSGCIENREAKTSASTDKNNNQSSSGRQLSNSKPEVTSYVSEFQCGEKESVRNVQKTFDFEQYNFSGIEPLVGDCYNSTADAKIIDNTLTININVIENEQNCNNCSQSYLSYSGTINVPSNLKVDESEIKITKY